MGQPEPQTEEPELEPGGTDMPASAVPERPPISRDLPTEANPAAEKAPDEVLEPDDKSQEPEEGSSGDDAETEEPSA